MNDLIKCMNEFAKHYEKEVNLKKTNKLNDVLTIQSFVRFFDFKVNLD